jgi:hypothetical protein
MENYRFLPPARIEHYRGSFDDASIEWLASRLVERN